MSQPSLYDDDILEWSERQGAALRKLAQVYHNLSNELDWERVAEEIEDVGRSELATVQSLSRQVLIHLIKAISVPDKQLFLNWRREALAFQAEILDRISPSMPRRIDIDAIWQRAISQAEADLEVYGQAILPSLPKRCPLVIQQILDPKFDFISLSETLRDQFTNGGAR